MLSALLRTPLHRRRQTMAVAAWFYCPLLSLVVLLVLIRYYKYTWWLLLAYFSWYFYSLRMPFHGETVAGLKGLVLRLGIFTHFSAYFPINIHYDGDAEVLVQKHSQLMFGYHPHGIFGLGAVGAFAMSRPVCTSRFKLRLLTVDFNFYIPIWREVLMSLGLAGVGRESVKCLLQSGHSLAIVIGGAREALDAKPSSYDLVLRKRRGFFREALQHGCAVVPVFGFGENELYVQMVRDRDSWLRACQDRLIHIFGFTLPLFNGRGMFNYERGVLPRRHPVNVVIGEPIEVQAVSVPSEEDITLLQEEYICRLEAIYDRHKKHFHPQGRPPKLRIVQ